MAKRTTKQQQAREMAMQALAERHARQKKITEATERAYLAQGELEIIQQRFASALQELDELGESRSWICESFGLTPAELRHLLALNAAAESQEKTSNSEPSPQHPINGENY